MLSFFPRGVLDEILNLIESVSEDFPSYSSIFCMFHARYSVHTVSCKEHTTDGVYHSTGTMGSLYHYPLEFLLPTAFHLDVERGVKSMPSDYQSSTDKIT